VVKKGVRQHNRTPLGQATGEFCAMNNAQSNPVVFSLKKSKRCIGINDLASWRAFFSANFRKVRPPDLDWKISRPATPHEGMPDIFPGTILD